MVDAWTSRGGSQFLNSAGTGRYLDYLCDEVVPFVDGRYPTRADRDHRGLTGKSSGGYGAMVVPMLRPEVFGALASHAGDALFECCYLPEFPQAARALRDNFEGSWEVFNQRLAAADHLEFSRFGAPLNVYAMGCVYSPDPERPGEALVPFETETGRLIDDVWQRWLSYDPVRMAPEHARRAAQHAPDLPRRRPRRRVLPRPRGPGLRRRADKLGVDAHARAVRRQARRHRLPLSGGHPRAGDGAGVTATGADLDLAFAGPGALAAQVRAGEVSPRELVELFVRRIEALNPRLNAFRDAVRRAGAGRGRAPSRARTGRWPACRSRSRTTSPVAGQVATKGSRSYGPPATADAEAVRRLRPPGRSRSGSPTSRS